MLISRLVVLAAATVLVSTVGFPTPVPPATPTPSRPPEAASPTLAFPSAWKGHWVGEAVNDNGVDPAQRFTMELVVGELTSPTAPSEPQACEWTILYRGDPASSPSSERPVQERRYRLLVRDAAKGEYAIDERNGIVIESRLLHGALYSHFLVQGTRITTREKLEGVGTPDERLEVEMLVTQDERAVVSGGAESVPEVRSWMPRSIQRATLRRNPMKSPDPTR